MPEAFQGILEAVSVRPAALPPLAVMPPGRAAVMGALGGTVPVSSGAEAFNLDELERLAIQRALAATQGNRTRAAKLLGISERTLRNKLNTPREEPAAIDN
jgi:DNA-binding NtrC family response regulator